MITKELKQKLDPQNKYTEEYVEFRINHKRDENRNRGLEEENDLEIIDLDLEYADAYMSNKLIKFNRSYIEKRVRENKIGY